MYIIFKFLKRFTFTYTRFSHIHIFTIFISSATFVPSEPTFPRAFVDFNRDIMDYNNISVTFR